jgi:hypothetical protein
MFCHLFKESDVGWACGTQGRGEKRVQDFVGKARRQETARKTEDLMGGWDLEWNLGKLARGRGVDPAGSE